MSRPISLAVVVTSLLAASCFSRGSVHSYRTESGRPLAGLDEGPEAYLVWRDEAGWHLRARSDIPRVFHGWVDTGKRRSFTPAGVPPDAVRAEGETIAFSFVTAGPGEAGFDWSAHECPELSIYVDGESRPLRVFAGEYGASPPRIPFTFCE